METQLHCSFVLSLLSHQATGWRKSISNLLLASFFCQGFSWLKWTAFSVITSKVTVLKNLYSLYIHVIRLKRRKKNKVFLSPLQSIFSLSLALLKHDLNKRGFIFEGIRQWPFINLVILIHGYSYLILLEVVVGYRKLRNFQGTQVNLRMLLVKLDITYPSRNS